jgi:hypothetical protein
MHITIDNASQFRDEFHRAGRKDQFSYEGLGLLFDYLEEIDPDYDLDVIALCCDYSEGYPSEIAETYGLEYEDNVGFDANAVRAYLEAYTSIVGETSTGAIIYAQF